MKYVIIARRYKLCINLMSNKERLELSFTSPFPDTPLSGDTERPESPCTFKEITAKFINKLSPQECTEDELKEELITIIVEIGNNEEDTIVVHKGDNANDLAEKFALKHNLSAHMKARLKDNIHNNITNALNELNPPTEECPENISDEEQDQSFFETNNAGFMGKKMAERVPIQCSKANLLKDTTGEEVRKNGSGNASTKDTMRVCGNADTMNSAPIRNTQLAIGSYKQTNKITQNIGERLYREGIREKEEREKRNKKLKKEKEKEGQSFNFQPNINPLSKNITRSIVNQSKVEDRLNKDKKVIERIENLKTLKIIEERVNCTFKPQISKFSLKLVGNSNRISSNIDSSSSFRSSRNKFDFLFEDAKRRKLNQERVEKFTRNNECTFRPKIANHFATYKKSQAKKPRVAEIMVNQPLHRPKTGRGPRTQRNQEGTDIGEYLYLQSKAKQKLMKLLVKEELTKGKLLRNRSFVQNQSKKMVDNKKITSFKSIFNALDNDSDGKISTRNISLIGTYITIY